LTRSDGVVFVVTATVVIAGGVAEVSVESQEGGEDKNTDSGEMLTFVSTPTGVDAETTVTTDGLTGGSDTWTLEQYGEAVNSSFKEPARGGSDTDYKHWTKIVLDAFSVWVFGHSTHPAITSGDVEVYFLMEDYTDGIPPLADRDRVVAYIDTIRPVGMGDLTCPAITAEPIYYDISLSPNTTTIQEAVQESLESLHSSMAGVIVGSGVGVVTTGQMYRAISDTTGVVDFTLNYVEDADPPTTAPANQTPSSRDNILTVGGIDWSAI